MKVDGIDIPGSVEDWARDWYSQGESRFTALQVELWCREKLKDDILARRRAAQISIRLADRLIQKGKSLGLWSFDGKAWSRKET